MSDSIVIVTGGRSYSDVRHVESVLNNVALDRSFVLYEGGAGGADSIARSWAEKNGIECKTFCADWKQFGSAAGPIRNKAMLSEALSIAKEVIVIAFPGGRGTANMCMLAIDASKSTNRVKLIRSMP